jgi:hypothetical protein
MDVFLSVLSGMNCKVYDDFIADSGMHAPYLAAILQLFQMLSLVLLGHNDTLFSVFFYTANLLNAASNWYGYSSPYEVAMIVLTPIVIAWSWKPMTMSILDLLWTFGFFLLMFFEPFFFPEETSLLKFIFRFGVAYSCAVQGIVMREYLSPSIMKSIWFGGGYCLVSSIVQMLRQTCLA